MIGLRMIGLRMIDQRMHGWKTICLRKLSSNVRR
jgi:hypothetical protein